MGWLLGLEPHKFTHIDGAAAGIPPGGYVFFSRDASQPTDASTSCDATLPEHKR